MSPRGKITLLFFCFVVCGTAAMMSHYLETSAATHGVTVRPADLYAVVNTQLADLREANFSRAYEHASAGIQQRFNIEQFAEMIRSDYGRIVSAKHVEFGFVEVHGRHALIQVFFMDEAGRVTPCIYSLVSEGEGWKIDGARLMRHWPVGARLGGMRS
jgi:Domain of unknown function (DUF4864)